MKPSLLATFLLKRFSSFSFLPRLLPFKVIAFANWENKTAGDIATRSSGERLRALEGAGAEALLARRRRLADLYNREMEQWEHEVGRAFRYIDKREMEEWTHEGRVCFRVRCAKKLDGGWRMSHKV